MTYRWADKAIDDMKASHEAEVANLRADLRAKETEALGYLRAVGTLQERIDKLEKALEPFAKAGQVIDGPFGPALFREDDMAFQSGCAWSENGERRTITWGDFRRARAALAEAKGGADVKARN